MLKNQTVLKKCPAIIEISQESQRRVKQNVFEAYTNFSLGLLTLRLIAGLIFFLHGAQMLFGVFNGPGLAGTMSAYGPGGGGLTGLLVAIGEFFGGLGLITGFLARFSAGVNSLIMIGAIYLVHGQNGFFMLGAGYKYAGGFEYNLALIGLCLPVLLVGPGTFSLNRILPVFRRKRSALPARLGE